MKDQKAPQHEFFIYVPVSKTEASYDEQAVEIDGDLPPTVVDWVKIPISGQLVVYAHFSETSEQIAS